MTLIDLLRNRAEGNCSENTGYFFLDDGESISDSITYFELDRKARSFANLISESTKPGERALLLYPPGLEYISAFFGCLYAGVIAVPAYPPSGKRSWPKLQRIAANSQATLALSTEKIHRQTGDKKLNFDCLPDMNWIATDNVEPTRAEMWENLDISEESIAFLQYTSGSTSDPKGVILSHRNILANEEMIYKAFAHSEQSVLVSWLPPYHDMGFIGNLLQPLYANFPCYFMAPGRFVEKPIRWLKAMSSFMGTTSGAPNFAYDLCVRKITNESCTEIDLSSWNLAYNGSEQVRAQTIDEFAKKFKPYGFSRKSFFPCYGLAEASLYVTGIGVGSDPIYKKLKRESMEQHEVVSSEDAESSQTFIACGKTNLSQVLKIVDPKSQKELEEAQVGEIWVKGPNVSQGYWNSDSTNLQTFGFKTNNDPDESYMRTGDLGFQCDGELYVTGRIKDLIIINGRNIYPHDIELTAEKAHPKIRAACTAAFSIDSVDSEKLVIVAEISYPFKRIDFKYVAQQVREFVFREHGVDNTRIVLLKTGGLPKTTSGKIQRRLCKTQLSMGTLPVIFDLDQAAILQVSGVSIETELDQYEDEIEKWLVSQISTLLEIPPNRRLLDQSLASLGINSIKALEQLHQIEERFGVILSVGELQEMDDLMALAQYIRNFVKNPDLYPTLVPQKKNNINDLIESLDTATEAEIDQMLANLEVNK